MKGIGLRPTLKQTRYITYKFSAFNSTSGVSDQTALLSWHISAHIDEIRCEEKSVWGGGGGGGA